LLHTGKMIGVFPNGLPVLRAGITEAGYDKDGGLEGHLIIICS